MRWIIIAACSLGLDLILYTVQLTVDAAVQGNRLGTRILELSKSLLIEVHHRKGVFAGAWNTLVDITHVYALPLGGHLITAHHDMLFVVSLPKFKLH